MDLEKILEGLAPQMERTMQDPCWHGEGDVLTHTKMVCEALTGLGVFREAREELQTILYLAAALHDIGKIHTTHMEDGRWASPGHARAGAQMARQLLWQEYGLCGTVEKQRLRESVCSLIRYHSLPPYAIENDSGACRLRRAASNGALSPAFTMELLCALSEADARGRICGDLRDMLERIDLCRELAREAGCYQGPYPFPSDYTAFQYLGGRNVSPEYPLYDDTWGEVVLLSGLPGTGKDTWIREHCPQLPMISLDGLRKELGISPLGNQGRVVEAATERAKELLRAKLPFVWNATNLTAQTRQRQVSLFSAYGASVRCVYLETDWEEQLRRNRGRAEAVPEKAICDMLEKLSPPERFEAHRVEWYCV